MRTILVLLLIVLASLTLAGCDPKKLGSSSRSTQTLAQARQGYTTKLTRQLRDGKPADRPATSELQLIRFPSPAGNLAAYVSAPPPGKKNLPAIIWIFGGFDNGIGATAWEPASPDNDQSARAFRQAGIVTMYPSFRGGNDNPGFREGFYGEVDDVIAAAQWLAQQPYVDPKRIYLGGHSTGGTLALLVAESTGGFRAVFSFGPVHDLRTYGPDELPFDLGDSKELDLRAPILWLNAINRPTFIFEGVEGNIVPLQNLAGGNNNMNIWFYQISDTDHFSILAKMTPVIAKEILADTGPTVRMTFQGHEISGKR